MSWWDTDEGDDVIGDQPADAVRHSLKQIAERKKPKLEDLLRAIACVANSETGKQMLEHVPSDLHGISAALKSGEKVTAQASEDDTTTRELAPALTENLKTIHNIYQERWERKPRLSEWLSVFSFVLRYRPEDHLDDGALQPPANITAEAGSE